jgi:hypothetical protein
MFILYAIPIGIVIGLLAGGRVGRLGELRLRWVPLMLVGLLLQVILFTDPIAVDFGDAGPPIYVASTAMVFVTVLRNVRVPGVALVALGAGSNLAAIVANGGFMPADPAAIESIGGLPDVYTNSIVVADAALRPLTDIFALPSWLPLANVFSVGDVLIGIGIAATIALAMRAGGPVEGAAAT